VSVFYHNPFSFASMGQEDLVSARSQQRRVLTVFFFLSGLVAASWSSRIPDVQHKLQLSNAALGTVLFALPVGLTTGLAIASWLVSSFGPKRMMIASAIFNAIALVLTGVADTSVILMVCLFLLGIGRTVFNLASNTASIELQHHYQKPIISTFHGIWSVAALASAGVGTVMIVYNVVPPYHFLTIAIIMVAATVAWGRKKKNDVPTKERKPFFVMPDKYLFLLGLIVLCAMLCEGAMFEWSVNYFEKVVKTEKSFVTTGYISFILAMSFGRLVSDRLIGRFGVFRMLLINAVLMASGFAIAAAFPFTLPAAFGFLLIGLGDSTLVPMIYMLAAKSKKMATAYALSSVTLIGYTGFLISPLLIGNVSHHYGMVATFFVLSCISLLVILLALRVRKMVAL
jgi:fucose permease